jgi:tripartite-type tricarboxylate transporter receptor subunit TctC
MDLMVATGCREKNKSKGGVAMDGVEFFKPGRPTRSSFAPWRRGVLAILGLIAVAAICSVAHPAQAQDSNYPTRPIRLVVSFPPGGGIDGVARLFADKLSTVLHQSVIVENRGGAAGSIAGKQVASAAPDGYTILVGSNSMVINQIVNPKSGLDVEHDLLAIASVAKQAIIIVTPPDLKVGSLKELIALAHQRPLTYGTPGAGSIPHLLIEELLEKIPGAKMTHVPFQGAGPALTATIAHQVDVGSMTLPPAIPLVKAGKLHGLAVTIPARSAALPQVPTTAEAGFPEVLGTAWAGIFVPLKTPKPIAKRIEDAILEVAAMPAIKERLIQLGYETASTPGAQFQKELSAETRMWKEVIAKSTLQPK